MSILRKILTHNYWAIFYFNFKMLPFKQAIKLPFVFYYSTRFESLSGKIILDNNCISRGMIKIGGRGSEMFPHTVTIIDLKGVLIINGKVEIGHGCLLRIEKEGSVSFGDHVRIGALTKIFCVKKITFKDEIDFSWECQIFDNNFHYIRNVVSKEIEPISGEIQIGSNNWFGNRITVMKNTNTPDSFIVASNSLCNKNYSDFPPYSVVGGVPVKLIGSGKQRIFENLEDISSFYE